MTLKRKRRNWKKEYERLYKHARRLERNNRQLTRELSHEKARYRVLLKSIERKISEIHKHVTRKSPPGIDFIRDGYGPVQFQHKP